MELAQRKVRVPAGRSDRQLYQWAFGAAVAVAAAYAVLASATLGDTVDGVPVSAIDAAWPFWLATVAVAAMAGVLAQVIFQLARPRLPVRVSPERLPSLEDQRRGTLAWVLPSVTAVASVLLVRLYHNQLVSLIGGAILLVVTAATIVAHYHLRDERPGRRALAGMSLMVLTHASAFFLLTMIYSNKWRSMYSATAIALATMLMLLQLTDGEEIAWLRRLLYAVIGGLLIGEMTWVLNYWAASGWTGGAMLLVMFYIIASLTVHTIRNNLGRRELVEYLAVGVVAFVIVTYTVMAYR